ncbi:MAG: hypothetical protein WD981_08605 [Gaiellaceae bacterium]
MRGDVEREVQHEPQVIEGEDEIPHQPADRAEYTPGTASGLARAGLWVALGLFLVVLAVVIWAIAA